MSSVFDEAVFYKDLRDLGIMPEDTVLINLNIAKFGLIKGFRRADYVEIFKRYFEQGGGMFFSLAFTPCAFTLTNKNLPQFDGTQAAYTGAFANAMLKDKGSFRSTHPTSSIVAIGEGAEKFISNLDEFAGAYTFARNLIDRKGKVLLVGMSEYPGFLTHLVEQDLKLYRQYWNRFFLKVRVGDRVFLREDPGGCSKTFERLYPEYIRREVLRTGRINGAYSLSVDSVDVYDIDREIITKNPEILICSDKKCSKCRVFRWRSIWNLPIYVFTKLCQRL
jgi:aminoglycoside N3'-acetyltransferase